MSPTPFSSSRCLHELVQAQVRKRPEAVALVGTGGEVTYGQLDRRAQELASVMARRGAGPEVRVGIYLDWSPEFVVAVLGTLKAGAACVPLEPGSESQPDFAAVRDQLRMVLTHRNAIAHPFLPETILRIDSARADASDLAGTTPPMPENLAFVLSSAGTSGAPRRVALEHAALTGLVEVLCRELEIGATGAMLADAPVSSEEAFLQMFLPLASGARILIESWNSARRTEARAPILHSDATMVLNSPSRWRRWLEAGFRPTKALRLLSTGEMLDSELARALRAEGTPLWNLYGCTEAGLITAGRLSDAELLPCVMRAAGARLHVLNRDRQRNAIGIPGELHVGSRLARGYSRDGSGTARSFLPDPFAVIPGRRLFRTGDRGRWLSDGRLELLGRNGDVAQGTLGPAEARRVENLLRAHPDLRDAAAVVSADPAGEPRLTAFLVMQPGRRLTAADLASYVKGKLPTHLEPQALVELDDLPLTPRGRLDRRSLEARARRELEPRRRLPQSPVPGEELDELCRKTNLSKHQMLMWAGQKLEPGAPIYNITALFTIEGPIDRSHLHRAFQALVDASDALRTILEEDQGVPRQTVLPEVRCSLPYHDFSTAPDPERRVRLWAAERSRKPFPFSDPLFDTALVKLSEEKFCWYLSQHHIITDGWSMALVFRQVSDLYRQSIEGRLETPTIPRFADFVAEERRAWETEAYLEDKRYWQTKLAEEIETTSFFGEEDRLASRSTRVRRLSWELGARQSVQLREWARTRREGEGHANRFLFAAFATLLLAYLYRVGGGRRLSVGIPIGNRRKRTRDTMGLLMRVCALRVTIAESETFHSLMSKVLRELTEAQRHWRYTCGNPPQRRAFDVLVNYHNIVFPDFDGMPARIEWIYPGHEVLNLALQVHDYEGSGSFVLDFDLNRQAFDSAEAQRVLDHFLSLLDQFLEDSRRPIDELGVLSGVEEHLLLREFNDTERVFSAGSHFVEIFEEQARATPDRTASICDGQWVTYGHLDAEAKALAARLEGLGVGFEDRVAVMADRQNDFLAALVAILVSGGVYLPVNPYDPPKRVGQVLRRSGAKVVLVDRKFEPALKEVLGELGAKGSPIVLGLAEGRDEPAQAHFVPRSIQPSHPSYVIYTSGSTGEPKGAIVEHRGMRNHLLAKVADLELSEDDLVAQIASQSFDISVWQFLSALTTGGRVIVIGDAIARDPVALMDLVEREGVTVLETVPTMLRAMLEVIAGLDTAAPPSFGRLRWLVVTGETLPPELCRRWLGFYPAVALMNAYGPTECSDDVTHYVCRGAPQGSRTPIGRPLVNMQIHVLDRSLVPAALETVGELCAGGVGVGRGYLRDPSRTAEVFVPDPFSERLGGRLYRTGDLARFQVDGNLDFLGRRDHQVKIRGHRIELGEIEAEMEKLPGVRAAVVVANEDAGGRRLLGYFVPTGGMSSPTAAELRSRLHERLPEYMIPVAFVPLRDLPLSPSGKVDRRALPAPDLSEPGSRENYVAPETPQEKELARIWSEVLGIERVGVHDNFFELGGESILAIQVVGRAARSGLRLTPRHLFQFQTIAELAHALGTSPVVEAEQGIVEGSMPLTPIQRLFLEGMTLHPHHYNHAVMLEVRGIEPRVLRDVVERMLAHHDALRLRFRKDASGWTQENAGTEAASALGVFHRVDLGPVEASKRRECLEQLAASLQTSLDLVEGPLARFVLIETGEAFRRLFVVIHHMAVDGVSWRILMEDLLSGYHQRSAGDPIQLPPKTTSFRTWTQSLQKLARSAELLSEIDFWREIVAGQHRSLPQDRIGGPNLVASARKVFSVLSAEETRALLQEAPAAYRSRTDEILLAAVLSAFHHWTGERSLLLELEGHGREDLSGEVDVSRTVGWFTTLYPVRLWLHRPGQPGEILKSVKEQLRRVPRGGIGYGLLRHLRGDERLAEELEVRAEVLFNYLGQFDNALTGVSRALEVQNHLRRFLSTSASVRLAPESVGPIQSPDAHRTHSIEISSQVVSGQLRVAWIYSENRHHRETVERLANRFSEALRQLIAHCLSPDAGGYTPSDFRTFRWSESDLDQITEAIQKSLDHDQEP